MLKCPSDACARGVPENLRETHKETVYYSYSQAKSAFKIP